MMHHQKIVLYSRHDKKTPSNREPNFEQSPLATDGRAAFWGLSSSLSHRPLRNPLAPCADG
jgi:hypothetical protein